MSNNTEKDQARFNRHRIDINKLRDDVEDVTDNIIDLEEAVFRKIHVIEDKIYDRIDRHRSHININRSSREADHERAMVTNEITNRRIHALEETCAKNKSSPFSVHKERHMASQVIKLSLNGEKTRSQVLELEDHVTNLSAKIYQLRGIPPKTCISCNNTFRSVKPSHHKCKDCYLFEKMKNCSICDGKFTPYHSSYKMCSNCYRDKKTRKSPEIFYSCSE